MVAAAQLGEPELEAEGHYQRARAGEQADAAGVAAEAARHHVPVVLSITACRALDDWLAYASRSRLASFVKLARTIRYYRESIEATLEWKLTNGISASNNAAIGCIRSAPEGSTTPRASSR